MHHEDGTPNPSPPPADPRVGGRRRKGLVRQVAETLLLALVMFLSVRTVGAAYEVDGVSMAPSLHDRQRLFVARAAYAHLDVGGLLDLLPGEDRAGETVWYPFDRPARGDVVVFESTEGGDHSLVKRVIALPGERVAFAAGAVHVNGQRLAEAYIGAGVETTCGQRQRCRLVVPDGYVFVLGDNRERSHDSRDFGLVPTERIVGKALVSFWPPDDVGRIPEPEYIDTRAGDA